MFSFFTMETRENYELNITNRSYLRYLAGYLIRWRNYLKYQRAVKIARKRGATIGEGVIMPIEFAKQLNANVTIGDHVSIHTTKFYPCGPRKVRIGNHVIIGDDVEFIFGGHNLNSEDWESQFPKRDFVIEDYVWLSPHCIVTPSCAKIGRGAVALTGSVLFHNVKDLTIMHGNPAVVLGERKEVHSKLVVETLLGGDFLMYKKLWKERKSK